MSARIAIAAAAALGLAAVLWLARPEVQEWFDNSLAADTPSADSGSEGTAGGGMHDAPGVTGTGSADASAADRLAAGEYLARAGNCIACHTRQGGAEYAGGRAISTPFGNVYSTNLTPEVETGLGAWTANDFWRAMRYGKSRDGRRLYPAFPYTSYTLISREDSDAIFAYLQSLEPVENPRIDPELRFPYNSKLALLVWRALFFEPGAFEPRQDRSTEWNRGAYLAEGLGHCGACHTARGALGGRNNETPYAGGNLPMQGWTVPPLRPVGTLGDDEAADLAALLKTGVSSRRAVTGPMAEVVFHSLQHLRDDDIAAIVQYIASLPPLPRESASVGTRVSERTRENLRQRGAAVYADHCADCHGRRGEGEPYVYPALAGNRQVTAASPANALRSILFGGFPPSTAGNPRPHGMPPYSHQLSDYDIAAVLTYVRGAWGNDAAPVAPVDIARR